MLTLPHQTKKKSLGWTSSYISTWSTPASTTCTTSVWWLFPFLQSYFGNWVEFEKMAAFSRFSALLEIVPFGLAINYYWLAIWCTRILKFVDLNLHQTTSVLLLYLQGVPKDEDAVEDNEWPCMGLTAKLLVAMCLPVTIMLQDWSLVEGTFDRWYWRNTLLDVACSYLQR